jgi:prenyl protein peptidase
VPLHVLGHFSGKQIVFLTPLYFGIAHLHHLYEFRITHPEVPLFVSILRSLFQFTYTSLFGFFATFVYLRTGNVFTCMLAHTFCNWMGLPRFYGRVGVEAGVPIGPPDVDKKDDEQKKAPAYRGGILQCSCGWGCRVLLAVVPSDGKQACLASSFGQGEGSVVIHKIERICQ